MHSVNFWGIYSYTYMTIKLLTINHSDFSSRIVHHLLIFSIFIFLLFDSLLAMTLLLLLWLLCEHSLCWSQFTKIPSFTYNVHCACTIKPFYSRVCRLCNNHACYIHSTKFGTDTGTVLLLPF